MSVETVSIWLPIATTLLGGGIAAGTAMLVLVFGKRRDVRDEHRRWVRQLRLDGYVAFLRQDEALWRRESDVMHLILEEASDLDVEKAKDVLREEQKRMAAIQTETLLVCSDTVRKHLEPLCWGRRPMTAWLIFSDRNTGVPQLIGFWAAFGGESAGQRVGRW